jgi:hypothetical protein
LFLPFLPLLETSSSNEESPSSLEEEFALFLEPLVLGLELLKLLHEIL